MNFTLSPAQEQLRDAARALLARACPMAAVRAALERPAGDDPALWGALADAGWLGLLVPDRHGGAGGALLDAAVLAEELGRALAPGPLRATIVAAPLALRLAGTRGQQAAWLPRLAAGAVRAAVTFAGERLVDDLADADVLVVVPARGGRGTLVAAPGARGRGVRRLPSVDPTRRPCAPPRAAAWRGAPLAFGTGGAARLRVAVAVARAAESVGVAARALELAVAWVRTRVQFGRPVATFQAVQHLAAEAHARLEPARALVWWAAWCWDARPREAALAAAMAAARAADTARAVTRAAVELHGGVGFTWDVDVQLYWKRALANAAAMGGAAAARARVATALLG